MLVTGAVLVGAGVDVEVAGTVVEGAGEEVAAAARKQHARSAPVPGRWPGGMRAQQMDRMTAWTTSVRWQPQGLTKMRLMHHQEHQKGHQVIEEPQHSHCDLKEGGRHTCDWSRGGRGGRCLSQDLHREALSIHYRSQACRHAARLRKHSGAAGWTVKGTRGLPSHIMLGKLQRSHQPGYVA